MTDYSAVAKKILEGLKVWHPKFDGVEHPSFVEHEIKFKLDIHEKVVPELNKKRLKGLMEDEKYEEFYEIVKWAASKCYNLLYLSSKEGDLSALYAEAIENDKQTFSERFFTLLHGKSPVEERIDAFVAWLNSLDVKPKWTFVTYYLFVLFPHDELFIKPSIYREFLEILGEKDRWSSMPSGELYKFIKEQLKRLGQEFPFEIKRGFLDYQGMI